MLPQPNSTCSSDADEEQDEQCNQVEGDAVVLGFHLKLLDVSQSRWYLQQRVDDTTFDNVAILVNLEVKAPVYPR